MDNGRSHRLSKHFDAIVYGRTPISSNSSALFIEAICAQKDRPDCISKLIAGKAGLDALQSSMRYRLDVDFFNGDACRLLHYLQGPDIKDLGGGVLLHEVVTKIVDPPIFWNAFRDSFDHRTLSIEAQRAFAWLLHFLVAYPTSPQTYHQEASARVPTLLASNDPAVSAFGAKIKQITDACNPASLPTLPNVPVPGGRHDNDFADFRKISIAPSAEEITSTQQPYLLRRPEVEEAPDDARIATHLDNQFRLLRQDMICEMKDELQIAFKKKKGHHRGTLVTGLQLSGIHFGADKRRTNWGLTFECTEDIPILRAIKTTKDRKAKLDDHRNTLRHQSMGCLLVDGNIVAFPIINRDEDLLAQDPPTLVLQLSDEAATTNALLKLKTGTEIKLLQIDTAIFSFAPILERLQTIRELPLLPELLLWTEGQPISQSPHQPQALVEKLERHLDQDLKNLLNTPKSITLDTFQLASLISGLTQSVSLIQGPPGTGKSLIGALIAKSLHEFTKVKILVVCYTNHALDDILTSFLDIGIPDADIVRLGGKSTQRTESLLLHKQNFTFRRDKNMWSIIDDLKSSSDYFQDVLLRRFSQYHNTNISLKNILEHIEFEDSDFFQAFCVPTRKDGLQLVGKKGRALDELYLIQRWVGGANAGLLMNESNVRGAHEIWGMKTSIRQERLAQWRHNILAEQIEGLFASASQYNKINARLSQQLSRKDTDILRSKRIIGCTTTAAAKYSKNIQAASPDVLLVEEAGEILESHVLTALTSATRQLVLIGDHKQLRPKVNDYQLTVEKGEGYDLNRSLFERLILKGYPHQTLTKQHRMRPEISALIRSLTYPELSDAPSTKNRPDLRGLQSNIIFVSHAHPEDDFSHANDKRDGDSNSSKQNTFEVDMVLKIVRYLAQQGYRTDEMVILTPYLGQLHKLQGALRNGRDTDPLLNDLDSYELVKAGLVTPAAAKMGKKSIRLATIDNYQGEESDVVIVSLTRSNPQNDIGFMNSSERVNVLLSRARNALIMIGNANTFSNSRKGGVLWKNVFNLWKKGGHVFDGFPTQCQRHPDRKFLLKSSDDFEANCPEGGCTEPCGIMLRCGLHACPSKCHQIYNHSKMDCEYVMHSNCSTGHKQTWRCHQDQPVVCAQCERQTKLAEKMRQKEYELQQQREADERQYQQKIDEISAQIAEQERVAKDLRLAQDREAALEQRKEDLQAAKNTASKMRNKLTYIVDTIGSFVGSTTPEPTNASTTSSKQMEILNSGQSYDSLSNETNSRNNQNTSNNSQSPLSGSPFEFASEDPDRDSGRPIPPVSPTASEIEWERQKTLLGANNAAIDAIMGLTGLESVKDSILTLKDTIDTRIRQGVPLNQLKLNVAFLGNPGTGKTTIAREYAKFLASIQALPADCFKETTGSRLANDGIDGTRKLLESIANAGGGTLFIDEAYQLTASHNHGGKNILDFLLAEMENNMGKIAFIVAGYSKEMEGLFEHNPGLQSRVPNKFLFEDYSDSELLSMFRSLIKKRYKGGMMIEGGDDGLFVRIAIRRLGRGRGRSGFGNARDLENMVNRVASFQAKRLREMRRQGLKTSDFHISGEDLIGPRPSDVLKKSSSWEKLHKMIGLQSVKDSVLNLTAIVEKNYDRELEEKEPLQLALNRIFLGSPGTGKTTVAALYGKILAELRLISNGEVVIKNPSDFIGAALGESEKKTKGILSTTIGKVLVIDEAYMLYGEGSQANDPYKTAVIDTIVAEVHNKPGDDRCVLMLGYKDKMMSMFQNVNEGLSRRFAVEDPITFEDFDNSQLLDILESKLKSQDISATDDAKAVAIQVLDRFRSRPNFGNAGEVENLLTAAKQRYQGRTRTQHPRSSDVILEPQDFDSDFDRGARSSENLKKLFEDVVGFDYLVEKLGEYQNIVSAAKQRDLDFRDHVPFNFVFKGPPGTGKTTVARKMGKVYYDMGILATTEVVECSATDLVAQYVGQTGPKTTKLLEKALGKVLFIDEAYRLSEGHFAQEAIDELVGLLTQERFKAKLIVILAGYDKDMNRLLAVNSGLASRFPEQIFFKNMMPNHCIELLRKQLIRQKVHLPGIDTPESKIHQDTIFAFIQLSKLPSWGNARDVLTLAKNMVAAALLSATPKNTDPIELSSAKALQCINIMLTEQLERCSNMPTSSGSNHRSQDLLPTQMDTRHPPPPPVANTIISIAEERHDDKKESVEEIPNFDDDGRDPGVSDEVWRELQEAKQAEEQRQNREAGKVAGLQKEAMVKREAARRQEREARRVEAAMKRAQDEQKRLELLKKLEAERLKAAEGRKRAAMAEQRRKQEEQRQEQERKKEAKRQEVLRSMGVCVAGFQWHKISGGYRCAGGSHYVSDSQLPS